MAKTRTQTGTISPPKYDAGSLRLRGESQSPKEKSPKEKVSGNKTGKRKTSGSLGKGKPLLSPINRGRFEQKPQINPQGTNVGYPTFWPSSVIGERQEEGLSAVIKAERRISQWKEILDVHKKNLPNAVPFIEHQLNLAKKGLRTLSAKKENHVFNDDEDRTRAIRDRVAVLESALAKSKFEPEKENIRGVIAGYLSGKILYSDMYSIVWAGRKVDEARTYADFTHDRMERLDRYAAQYGPHWLWWESPLASHPESQIMAMGCQIIERVAANHGFGPFFINQGFWKRSGFVHRMPQTAEMAPAKHEADFIRRFQDGTVQCFEPGPRLVIRSLLDSGASYPSIFYSDFCSLGIEEKYYGAQSIVPCQTANGLVQRKVYEMHVEIAANPGTPIIDPTNPINPAWPTYIGGLCPVVLDDKDNPEHHLNLDNEKGPRLSGIMPFLAPYISVTPAKNIILMGENRNDVMGGHKTPAARRWLVGHDQDPSSREEWDNFGDPRITFSHRGGALIDDDLDEALSVLTVNPGRKSEQKIYTDPRGDFNRRQDLPSAALAGGKT